MASVKKNSPSNANGTPNAAPHWPMKCGHSNPNSKLSTVPVTAPTAKVTAMYFDQRWASRSAAASSCLQRLVVGDQRHERPGHPERHEDDVERQGECHLRPRPRHGVHGQYQQPGPNHGRRVPDGRRPTWARSQPGARVHDPAVGEDRWWRSGSWPRAAEEGDDVGDLVGERPAARAGWRRRATFILAGSASVEALIGVSTAPGPTPTTRMPCGPSSTPAVRVSMRMPPLDRQ